MNYRIATMDRNCLDIFGLESSKSLYLAEQDRLKYSLLNVHTKTNAKAVWSDFQSNCLFICSNVT